MQKSRFRYCHEGGDFISVNCNVVPETVGLISREKIALMKPTAYFVNTARAKVLDYDALYDALAEKKIAGAGLDVYPIEPIPAGNKFYLFVMLFSHRILRVLPEILWDIRQKSF